MAKRRIKRPARELVLVEWVDSHYRPGWTTDGPEPEPVRITSVGWVVAEVRRRWCCAGIFQTRASRSGAGT